MKPKIPMIVSSPDASLNSHTNSSQSATLHNLANIFYTGILSGDLGVHIGVYKPYNWL